MFRNKGPAPDDQPFEITVPPDGTLNDIIITKPVIIVSVDPEDPEKESEPEKVDVPVKKPEIDVTKVTNEPIEITDENGNKLEPIEEITMDVDDEFSGTIIQKLQNRKGEMKEMKPMEQ